MSVDVIVPHGTRLIMAWLDPLPGDVRPKRRPNDPLPSRVVNRLGGPVDRFTDHGKYEIHDFAADYTSADNASQATLDRIRELGPPFAPQRFVTLAGRSVCVDLVVIDMAPHWEYYSDTIERFVTEISVDLRYIAAQSS